MTAVNKKTLDKQTIAKEISSKVGLNEHEAKEIVEAFLNTIKANLANSTNVKLSGFGNFMLRDKNERPGRNPKTKEEYTIKARRVCTLSPSKLLRAKVEAGLIGNA